MMDFSIPAHDIATLLGLLCAAFMAGALFAEFLLSTPGTPTASPALEPAQPDNEPAGVPAPTDRRTSALNADAGQQLTSRAQRHSR